MHKKSYILAGVGVAALILGSATVHAADVSPGQKLHDARCLGCHQPDTYAKAGSGITTLAKLKSQVATCNNAVKQGELWFDDEEAAVVNYLNQEFYKFPQESPGAK